MALDATPGGPDSNAYCSVSEATAFLAERLQVSAWYQVLTVTEGYQSLAHLREAALIWATSLIDQQTTWLGTPATTTQALDWPRTGLTESGGVPVDATTVPEDIQRATAYYALALLEDARAAGSGSGTTTATVRRKKIGALEIEYQQQDTATAPKAAHMSMPSEIRALLGGYGQVQGGLTIPVLRT